MSVDEKMVAAVGTKPNPDPTIATNDAVERAAKAERDYVDGRIQVLEERLTGIDTATSLRWDTIKNAASHEDIDTTNRHITELVGQRLGAVATQLELIERQRVEQKQDTKAAVDAALAAAKEAVKEQTTASGLSIAKSETATSEQLKQLNATFTTAIDGVRGSLDDIKERVSRIENQSLGARTQRQETREGISSAQAIFAIIAVVVVLVGTIIAANLKTSATSSSCPAGFVCTSQTP